MSTQTNKKSATRSNSPVIAESTPATVKLPAGRNEIVKPALVAAKPASAPTAEQIARRAYELYLARGRANGSDVQDWIQAERELSVGIRNN
jgi:hypothetical protein